MTDFHSHVIPRVDDGSRSSAMSIEMLRRMKEQGVGTVCCTSHYYASQYSPSHFLEVRDSAFEHLLGKLPEDLKDMTLLPGAEVLYFPGMAEAEELESLCIEGTDLFLLEMPFRKWSERETGEVFSLLRSGRFKIILAHTERYFYYQKDPRLFEELRSEGMVLQSNTGFFLRLKTRHRAFKLLSDGFVDIISTDAHNTEDRAPNMGAALKLIERKCGEKAAEALVKGGDTLLSHHLSGN